MGVIADHIKKKLEQDLRTKGLLIWLDKENIYSSLVDAWMAEKKDGRFRYEIFAFRGSFLELMVATRDVLSGRDMPKCVIHMPGFNEEDMKKNPVLEAYKAGQRWRVALDSMIREAAQGRLSEKQIQHLLSMDGLTLAKADEFISREEDIPQEIRGPLNTYGENGFVLEFLKNPAKINGELCLPPDQCFPVLKDYFGKLLGLDAQWQQDWNQNQVDYAHPDDQADILAAYLMAMEFVHDLSTDPGSERLKRLKKKQKEYLNKSSVILRELRESDPKRYIRWASQVEANLTPEECRFQNPRHLGSLDTFRFEADIFLDEAMTLLGKEQWTEALDLANIRLPRGRKGNIANTFWLQQDRERLWLWEWIETASRLGIQADAVMADVAAQNPGSATLETLSGLYADRWWMLDQHHRRFSSLSERYQATHTDLHIKAFIDIRKTLYITYRRSVDEQSRLWNRVCEARGFLPEDRFQQRYFFKNWVKPVLETKKKTAVFFVDALRFELGRELVRMFQSISSGCTITPILAELPTVTAVGMNALVPVVKDAQMVPLYDNKGGICGFQGGERQVRTPSDRLKTLQDHAGVDTAWIELKDLFSMSRQKMKKIGECGLLAVAVPDLDKIGEAGVLSYGGNYFETVLARVKTAVMKLKEAGFEEFVMTSDHGFLLGDESLETGRAPKLESAERRFAFGSERNSEHLVSAGLNQLNYAGSGPGAWFVFERSTHLLVNPIKTGFYHGGNTVQERVIPVISLSLKKTLPDTTGTFALTIQKKPDAMGFHRVSIVPVSKMPGLFSIPQVEVRLVSDDGVRVEIGDVVGAERSGDVLTLPLDKESEIYFKLWEGNRSKTTIFFQAIQEQTVLLNPNCPDFYEVENYSVESEPVKSGKKIPDAEKDSSRGFGSIPPEYHAALAHLEKHGTLTEKFLVNTLGGDGAAARKGRRFANLIAEWVRELPFDVFIEQTLEGKEYRKK